VSAPTARDVLPGDVITEPDAVAELRAQVPAWKRDAPALVVVRRVEAGRFQMRIFTEGGVVLTRSLGAPMAVETGRKPVAAKAVKPKPAATPDVGPVGPVTPDHEPAVAHRGQERADDPELDSLRELLIALIRAAMAQRGTTVDELARETGLSSGTVGQTLRLRQTLSLPTLLRLARWAGYEIALVPAKPGGET
jgi:DNA-binding phage protein